MDMKSIDTIQGHPMEGCMRRAVELARRGRGTAAPNPCVGAVLARDGQVLAEGWHKKYGGPHAEVEALKDAASKGVNPADCVMVVTLEPCNHHGKTPPCVDAILNAGIRHVVIGCLDQNPVAGGGAARLAANGVRVESGVAADACSELIADFLHWQQRGMPYAILKLASTLDGRIAARSGHSQWVSGPQSRARVHELRRFAQAVLVGGQTFLQDNPQLTFRADVLAGGACGATPEGTGNNHEPAPIFTPGLLSGYGSLPEEDAAQPLALVLTTRLPERPEEYFLLRERPHQTIFLTSHSVAASEQAKRLADSGARFMALPPAPKATCLDASCSGAGHSGAASNPGPNFAPGTGHGLDLAEAFTRLYKEFKCHYLLCEGGGRLGLALLQQRLAQEFHLHLAPKILADNRATPLFDGLAPATMAEALQLRLLSAIPCGDDLHLRFRV